MMSQRLALFDLDNTLLNGDSDHAWGEFLIHRGLVDENTHRDKNNLFYEDYLNENLDIQAYFSFTIEPLIKLTKEQRDRLHEDFMAFTINSLILPKAKRLVLDHKSKGDLCIIITATNSFITKPIADIFQVDHLLATELEVEGGRLTGRVSGIPCYQEGKLSRLQQWLERSIENFSLENSTFYSDSINDLILLEAVGTPIVVDPDQKLLQISQERGWTGISLR